MPTPSAVIHVSRRLKILALTTVMAIVVSGCSMTTLKQRETTLSHQQQRLAEQQLKLQQERRRLNKLKAALNQEQKRLTVLKKSLSPRTLDSTTDQPGAGSHVVIGELEHAFISPPDIQLSARMSLLTALICASATRKTFHAGQGWQL